MAKKVHPSIFSLRSFFFCNCCTFDLRLTELVTLMAFALHAFRKKNVINVQHFQALFITFKNEKPNSLLSSVVSLNTLRSYIRSSIPGQIIQQPKVVSVVFR